MLRLHFHPWQHFAHTTMALQMNNGHIIYYPMEATCSVGLVQTYFTHLIWSLKVRSTPPICFLIWLIRQGHMMTIMFSSFQGMDYMPLGTPCNHIMAILDHSDAAQPFIVATYPLYRLSLLINDTILLMSGISTVSISLLQAYYVSSPLCQWVCLCICVFFTLPFYCMPVFVYIPNLLGSFAFSLLFYWLVVYPIQSKYRIKTPPAI